ncbi:MAG: glycosyltransferase family 2 protein [Opitutaceae bacterium]|jgi:GT2 family glycosyltransferase
MTPQLAFLIVSYNTRELLDACLASVYRHTTGLPFEVIVVDNDSRDGSPAMVREKYPAVVLVESGANLGFGRANNLGFARSRAPFVLLLNSDALLLEDTGTALVRFLETHPRAGLAGPGIVLMDGTRQPKTRGMLPTARVMLNQNLLLSRLFPRSRFWAGLYVEAEWGREARVGWVSGVCVAVRREAYEQSGGFDPEIFMYAEDVDLCRRCAAHGWETWRVEAHAVKHLCGGSTRTDEQVLRHRVLQQRNFLRLLDRSMGPAGRAVTRGSFVVGLLMRSVLRGLASPVGGAGRRLAFRADLRCLSDFVGWARPRPEESHAHRT